jgi:hypothetical protein
MSEVQIKKSTLSIPITFEKVEEFNCDNSRFTKVKCWLMHTGRNLNGSEFEKEVIAEAIPSLQYIPIVGFIENNELDEKDFSDHRYVISTNENGIYRKYCGSAYGVILSDKDNNAHFETKICNDGQEREFIVSTGIIWNMFEDSKNIFDRDFIKDHSIELDENSVDGYEDENGIFHFTKFSFRAACVLGGGCQPAMTGSTVEVQFTMKDFVNNLHSELNDKYSEFTKLVGETINQTFTKPNELVNENNKGGIATMQNTDFSTVLQMFNDISNTIAQHEMIEDRWGDKYSRYYAVDIQENEVIVVDRMNNYNYFGFSFAMNGDSVEIDFENCKRKKISYEDYVDGVETPEGAFDFGKHIADIEESAFTKVNEANTKVETAEQAKIEAETNYTAIKADYDDMKPKYDAYVLAEEQRQAAELEAQKDAKFAEYEDILSENADFAALKERKSELSVDDIEKECAVLYVKANRTKSNFSKTSGTSVVTGVLKEDDYSNDGYVDTKYGRVRKSR